MKRDIIKSPNKGPDAPNLVSGKLYWIYSPKVGKYKKSITGLSVFRLTLENNE